MAPNIRGEKKFKAVFLKKYGLRAAFISDSMSKLQTYFIRIYNGESQGNAYFGSYLGSFAGTLKLKNFCFRDTVVEESTFLDFLPIALKNQNSFLKSTWITKK